MLVTVYFSMVFLGQYEFILPHSYATFVNDNVPEAPTSLTFEDFRRAQNPPPDQPIDEAELLRADLVEGDIAGLTRNSFNQIIEEAAVISRDSLLAKSAVRSRYKLWPSGIIPYVVSNKYTSDARAKLANAFMDFHEQTCVRFIHKRPADRDYVYIRPTGGGCYSHGVGRRGGNQAQTLSLDEKCFHQHGKIIHELMHAIGFFHEHNRNDRDDYIEVHLQNAIQEDRIQFRKRSLEVIDHLGTGYDYGSVMHCGRFAFSRNGRPTIVPKQKADIGQRKGFSYHDVRRINLLYCDGSRSTPDPYPPEPVPLPTPPPPPPLTPDPSEIVRDPCFYQIPGTKLLITVEPGCFRIVKHEQNTIIASCESDGTPVGVTVSDKNSVRAEAQRWERRGMRRCFTKGIRTSWDFPTTLRS